MVTVSNAVSANVTALFLSSSAPIFDTTASASDVKVKCTPASLPYTTPATRTSSRLISSPTRSTNFAATDLMNSR